MADIRRGKPLSATLLNQRFISSWEAKFLTIGENSGRLEYILRDLESYFDSRNKQIREVHSKLLYPIIMIVFAILVPPLPQIAQNTLSVGGYLFGSGLKLFILYLLYQWLFVKPLITTSTGAINPLLINSLQYVGPNSFLREVFEISYLNLLTLCLESGMDAATALRILKDNSNNKDFRQLHTQALIDIEKHGLSLTAALTKHGIIQHNQTKAFLNTSEQSGTLHSGMRQFIAGKKEEVTGEINFRMQKYCQWFYFVIIAYIALRIIGMM
jgi:type II secretory pathway component PulF